MKSPLIITLVIILVAAAAGVFFFKKKNQATPLATAPANKPGKLQEIVNAVEDLAEATGLKTLAEQQGIFDNTSKSAKAFSSNNSLGQQLLQTNSTFEVYTGQRKA